MRLRGGLRIEGGARWTLSYALGVALVLCAAGPARAAGRPSGLRVTVTGVAGTTVNVDVTLNTNSVYPAVTAAGLLGNRIYNPYASNIGTLLNPVLPALDWGDGVGTVAGTTIPNVSPGVYRGSFSHTYAAPGAFTVTSNAAARVGYVSTVGPVMTTGNSVIVTAFSFRAVNALGTATSTYTFTGLAPYIIGVTATATAAPVPTASTWAVLVLAVLLILSGVVVLLRRRRTHPA